MNELINHPKYLNQLIKNKDVDLVKIVTGIRRCGKSLILDLFHNYLVKERIKEENIVHINSESLKYKDFNNYLAIYKYIKDKVVKNERYYLIFD